MGDRVLFQVVSREDGKRRVSPVAYGHWCGARAPEIAAKLKARMATRGADVPYTFARLIQEMVRDDDGNLSFGAWNCARLLKEADSHGDAGIVLIRYDKADDRSMTFECMGGYLEVGPDGLPRDKPGG